MDGTPKRGHGAGSREKRLRAMRHWPEIEIRLRHRWSPDEVAEWYKRAYPSEPVPARMTLYRFLKEQEKSWYVEQLLIGQSGTERAPRILVLERQANLIQTQTIRLNAALAMEAKLNGLLVPEVRANLELLDRMLERHEITQQEFGLAPKVTPVSKDDRDEHDGAEIRELHDLVAKLNELPPEEFVQAMVALIGPPPVKQPLQLGEAVILTANPQRTPEALARPLVNDAPVPHRRAHLREGAHV